MRDTLQGLYEAAEVLSDFSVSFWAKDYLRMALERPPADALRDAETLASALREHCNTVLQQGGDDV